MSWPAEVTILERRCLTCIVASVMGAACLEIGVPVPMACQQILDNVAAQLPLFEGVRQ